MNLSHFQIIVSPFIPSSLDTLTIRREFIQQVNKFFRSNSIKDKDIIRGAVFIRDPDDNVYFQKDPTARDWHQDYFSEEGDHEAWLFLWSNKNSTILRDTALNEVIRVPDGCLVLFDNERFEHRADTSVIFQDRWFARLMFKKANKNNDQ